ncbi:phosphorylase family protein, partial [Bacteroides fragilis]
MLSSPFDLLPCRKGNLKILLSKARKARMSDKDTSCYIYIPHGNTHSTNTLHVIVANHCGIKVFGISVVTDLGVEGKIVEVSHEEVQKAADAAQPKMTTIMRELINRA